MLRESSESVGVELCEKGSASSLVRSIDSSTETRLEEP